MLRNTPRPIRRKRPPAEKEAICAQPLRVQYVVIHVNAETFFKVLQHILVDPAARDYGQVRAVAIAYTEECDCWINPEVNVYAPEARKKIFPGIEDNANPDLYTEKYGYIDVKSPQNKSNIVRNANSACQQGAIAVITDLEMADELSHKRIRQITDKIFSEQNRNHHGLPNYTKDELHWFVKGMLLKYNRPKKK